MDSLTPNMALLKNPFNWFFVAFCVVILVYIFHLYNKKEA